MKLFIVGDRLRSYNGYTTPAQRILQDILTEAGLRMQDVTIVAPDAAQAALRRSRPHAVLALGNPAAATCIPTFDARDGVHRLRGYIFEGVGGVKVIPSVDPETAAASWVPWRVLLSYDLQRAKEEASHAALVRPDRRVHVVRSLADARRAAQILEGSRRVAADIEIHDATRLQCVGFAPDRGNAYVFPVRFADSAYELLRTLPGLCFQNGQFDAHFLKTRCGVDVTVSDDTLVAWHACYPELAGASQDAIGRRSGAKRTHKSLAFLASLFTQDAPWKDYDTDDEGMYLLNGRDCCITYEIMEALDAEIDRLGVRPIYRHTLSLIDPCVAMQARGLPIDDTVRATRVDALQARLDSASERLNTLVAPLLEASIDRLKPEVAALFRWRNVCTCCRNGAGKRDACWSCAGFPKAPGKRALAEYGKPLTPCAHCGGKGEFTGLTFNPRSGPQKAALLHDILKLPPRYVDGRVSVDSDALKSLLPLVA